MERLLVSLELQAKGSVASVAPPNPEPLLDAVLLAALWKFLGHGDLEFFIPGPPVPRPAGRPFQARPFQVDAYRTEIQAIRMATNPTPSMATRARKLTRLIQKAQGWERLDAYRSRCRLVVMGHPVVRNHGPYSEAIFAIMTFYRPRPQSHKPGKNWPMLVTARPDGKNMRFALEDALNGILWVDDGQVDATVLRRYAGEGQPEGTHLRMWTLDKACK